MFYQVKVLDKTGKVKKIVRSEELSRRYWVAFYKEMNDESLVKTEKNRRRQKTSKKLDLADNTQVWVN